MTTLAFAILVAVLMAFFFVAELRARPGRHTEALYLVSRVASRHRLHLQKKSLHRGILSVEIPWSHDQATLHYHLLRPGGERDSITLTARFGKNRLGHLVISSDPARIFCAGLRYLDLNTPQLDHCFRIFTQIDRQAVMLNLLESSSDLLRTLQDLACRTPTGRFELVDLGGHLKIQVNDKSLRFPSDVEKATLDLVRLYQLYLVLAGARDVRDAPAMASPVAP